MEQVLLVFGYTLPFLSVVKTTVPSRAQGLDLAKTRTSKKLQLIKGLHSILVGHWT